MVGNLNGGPQMDNTLSRRSAIEQDTVAGPRRDLESELGHDPARAGDPPNGPGPSGLSVPQLRVRLLGGFRVDRADTIRAVSDWQRRSAKTLTKLLATHPRHALHREQILDILWPGADVDSALNSLAKALHAARHAFEPELPRRKDSTYLKLEDAMVVLNTEHVAIDADRFERLAGDSLRCRDITAYESALVAYGGELLPEDRYEDWCAERRGSLAELHIRVLLGVAEELERRGAYNESADRLREVLKEDQTREEVHRRLMRLYAEMGISDQAIRQFQLCADVLKRELDLAPQRETVSLYQDILASRITNSDSALDRVHKTVESRRAPAGRLSGARPFVGREQVLQSLCRQLTRAPGSGPGVIIASGEAGVGKTRLLEELTAEASRLGALVLWGGSGAHAHRFACGPFAVALEGYAAARSAAERDELAHRYPPLARFVPSLGIRSQGAADAAGPEGHHSDLIPAIVRLLTGLASARPVLLVLGDLHDADPASLDLLRYLAQLAASRRWLMVGAVREEELEAATELGRMVEATIRDRLCLKIGLECLSRRDCGQLVRALVPGGSIGAELAERIYQWSRGNPLFVEELVREMREGAELISGGCDGLDSSWAGPQVLPRVRALTAARLAGIDETLRRVLGLAAAARSEEISLSHLRAAAAALDPPVCDPALFDALDRALHLGLLEERKRGYAFRYPLVRSALYEGLSRHRRDQFHAALAVRNGTSRVGWL
jgi:DNA-binding SARP family transcriptional activator